MEKHIKRLKSLENKRWQNENNTTNNKNFPQNSLNSRGGKTEKKHRRNKISTVSKSIAYRKSYDSLENELGESIGVEQIVKEFNRFDLVKDKDNLKDKNNQNKKEKNRIKNENLKNRQIWHSMFSLPNNFADNEVFLKAMQESLQELFSGHKYAYGIHNNTKIPIVILP